jgi:hypothetical protein
MRSVLFGKTGAEPPLGEEGTGPLNDKVNLHVVEIDLLGEGVCHRNYNTEVLTLSNWTALMCVSRWSTFRVVLITNVGSTTVFQTSTQV